MRKATCSLDVNSSQPLTHLLLVHPALWVSLGDDASRKVFVWQSLPLENDHGWQFLAISLATENYSEG